MSRILHLTEIERQQLMRHDLSSFIAGSFVQLNPGTPYRHNWHIDLLAARLTAFAEGRITRLVITLPPRSLKSHCASIALPAWILGHDPTRRIVCASYSQELADFLARQCRTLMLSPFYQRLFPATRLSAMRASVAEFMTIREGMRLATSVGGTLTGKGGDFLIIDDPVKPEDALSDLLRTGANQWYESTAFPRLNDKARGGILIIMQRLHEDDLVGHVLRQEGWEVIRLPAIADAEEEYRIGTMLGTQVVRRHIGDPLHAARESLETLQKIRASLGEYHFAGQYQQDPAPRGGGLLKEPWLQYYAPHERPASFDQIVQSWDTASKVSELADYSVCTTWGWNRAGVYLLDVTRVKVDFPGLRNEAIRLARAYEPKVILVEDRSSGIQLIQELASRGIHKVKARSPRGDKAVRFASVTGMFETGTVRLPDRAPWLPDYIHELTTFPRGRHDDQVDSTTQALTWIQEVSNEPGLIAYYRHLVEEMHGKQGY